MLYVVEVLPRCGQHRTHSNAGVVFHTPCSTFNLILGLQSTSKKTVRVSVRARIIILGAPVRVVKSAHVGKILLGGVAQANEF